MQLRFSRNAILTAIMAMAMTNKKRTGSGQNRSLSKMFESVLRFFSVRRFVRCFVDELEKFRSVEIRRKRISNLLSVFGLSNHLLLSNLCVRNVYVRTSLQIVKLHKSLLGRGNLAAFLHSNLRLAQPQVQWKLGETI